MMLTTPLDILTQFPVRKTKKQKQAFREAVQAYAGSLGYEARVEKGSFGVRNVVIGDPQKAKYLVTAHYDTCAWLPFPNLITPCSFWLFLGWQLLLVVLLALPVGIIGGVAGALLNEPILGFNLAYLLLLAELFLMLLGPANRHNANDNTSGVVTVLELAAALPVAQRGQVCFVLFDLEEAGLLGSSAYRSKHRKETDSQIILNLDCVGEGDEILLFPTKKLKKHGVMAKLQAACKTDGAKTVTLKDKGFAIYPSDQANFPLGLGIAAFCRSRRNVLYLAKIHTAKDRILDETNVRLIRDYLMEAILAQEEAPCK